ncbi:hypothetical protein BR93DRAFT_923730 [Coniochaeta sp. PMI_546]|nr:hypothetical protein BR93DRAFT_923730 [Coniochaeta sp. PMI_546]
MSTSDSYVFSDMSPPTEDDDVDSLPSVSSGILSSETDSEYGSDAQKEWERSLDQLQLLLTMVLVPFVGKYLGRKFAYWSWARYMEWMHDVEIQFTSKKTFKAAGAVEAAATL